jgi:bromodomain-containing protein 7/9
MKEAIRDGLQRHRQQATSTTATDLNTDSGPASYWTPARATEAETYIQDVVYGGEDGYAYVRSLAEFVGDIAQLDRSVGYLLPPTD